MFLTFVFITLIPVKAISFYCHYLNLANVCTNDNTSDRHSLHLTNIASVRELVISEFLQISDCFFRSFFLFGFQ
jgi:hypothetical protein